MRRNPAAAASPWHRDTQTKTVNDFALTPAGHLQPSLTGTRARASHPLTSRLHTLAEYVLHMHSFINLRRDIASSDMRTRARALKRGQQTCL